MEVCFERHRRVLCGQIDQILDKMCTSHNVPYGIAAVNFGDSWFLNYFYSTVIPKSLLNCCSGESPLQKPTLSCSFNIKCQVQQQTWPIEARVSCVSIELIKVDLQIQFQLKFCHENRGFWWFWLKLRRCHTASLSNYNKLEQTCNVQRATILLEKKG